MRFVRRNVNLARRKSACSALRSNTYKTCIMFYFWLYCFNLYPHPSGYWRSGEQKRHLPPLINVEGCVRVIVVLLGLLDKRKGVEEDDLISANYQYIVGPSRQSARGRSRVNGVPRHYGRNNLAATLTATYSEPSLTIFTRNNDLCSS